MSNDFALYVRVILVAACLSLGGERVIADSDDKRAADLAKSLQLISTELNAFLSRFETWEAEYEMEDHFVRTQTVRDPESGEVREAAKIEITRAASVSCLVSLKTGEWKSKYSELSDGSFAVIDGEDPIPLDRLFEPLSIDFIATGGRLGELNDTFKVAGIPEQPDDPFLVTGETESVVRIRTPRGSFLAADGNEHFDPRRFFSVDNKLLAEKFSLYSSVLTGESSEARDRLLRIVTVEDDGNLLKIGIAYDSRDPQKTPPKLTLTLDPQRSYRPVSYVLGADGSDPIQEKSWTYSDEFLVSPSVYRFVSRDARTLELVVDRHIRTKKEVMDRPVAPDAFSFVALAKVDGQRILDEDSGELFVKSGSGMVPASEYQPSPTSLEPAP